jgi:hypothetical protein
MGENPVPPEFRCSGRVDTEDCHTISTRPWVGIWLWEAMKPQPASGGGGSPRSLGLTEARDNRSSTSGIPDTVGHHGRAENKMGVPGDSSVIPRA